MNLTQLKQAIQLLVPVIYTAMALPYTFFSRSNTMKKITQHVVLWKMNKSRSRDSSAQNFWDLPRKLHKTITKHLHNRLHNEIIDEELINLMAMKYIKFNAWKIN